MLLSFLQALWSLSLEAAPWLVIGFVLGGLFKSLIPISFLQRHLAGKGLLPVLKAAILGMPLPLCSCGVIPAAMSLRDAGASKSSTSAFLVSTPETGVDSIAVSYALLGPVMAIMRPIAAFYSAMVTGLLVSSFAEDNSRPTELTTRKNSSTCCGSTSEAAIKSSTPTMSERLHTAWDGIYYTFSRLYFDILQWLVIGLIVAAALQTCLPEGFLAQWGQSSYALFVMAVIGIPMYVCATASTPIAASLLMAGVSPGAAMVFLMAGPATNIATIGIMRQKLGARAAVFYLIGVMLSAISTGWLVDQWLAIKTVQLHMHSAHHIFAFGWQIASLLFLVSIAVIKLILITKHKYIGG